MRIRTTKGRIENWEYVCAVPALSAVQSVPTHQKINWKANSVLNFHIESVWVILVDLRLLNSYLEISSPWLLKRVNLEDLKTVSSVLYSCEMSGTFLLSPFILFLVTLFYIIEGRNFQRWLCHWTVWVRTLDLYRIQSCILTSWNLAQMLFSSVAILVN